MLKINFLNATIDDTKALEFAMAVKFEELDMTLTMSKETLARLENKIKNESGNYTEEQVEGFKSEKAELEKEIKVIQTNLEEARPVYDKVISDMTKVAKTDETGSEYGNPLTNVRNILRCIATASNSKLEKYALDLGLDSDIQKRLFDAFETCHDIQTSRDTGMVSETKEVRQAYKQAEGDIQFILKNALSLPFATDYTESLRIKFNASSMRALHESYTKGFSNKFKTSKKSDDITFECLNVRTSITAKKDKSGKVTYNFSDMAKTICTLVIAYLAK